MVAEKAKDVLG